VVTVRAAARRTARRLIAARPGQTVVVAIICAIAIASGVVAHGYAMRARAELERHAGLRHGAVAVSAPAGAGPSGAGPAGAGSADADPAGAGAPAGDARTFELASAPGLAGALMDPAAAGGAEQAIARLGGRAFRRAELAAHAPDGSIRAVVAVEPDDPGLQLVASSGPTGGFRIAVRRGGARTSSPVEWITLSADAVYGFDRSGVAWADLRRVTEALPWSKGEAYPAANLVVAGEIPADTTVFAFAYDLSQRLADAGLALDALAWPEIVGYARYAGAGATAALVGPLALAVAALAVAGTVAVAVRNRMRDTVLLRTLGFEVGVIRGIHVREIAAASAGAAVLVLLAVVVASGLGAQLRVDAAVRRIALGGAALPPLVAFLTARRQLRAPLATVRREVDL